MKIEPNSKLVMIGDSITDCGRATPTGRPPDGLGAGYVHFIWTILSAVCPARRIEIINTGVGGNTVKHLAERWRADVIDLKPDWLSVKIGINDVWRQFDRTDEPATHVYLGDYKPTLEKLIAGVRPSLKGLILATPYFIEPDRNDPMRAMMDRYGQVVKRLAVKYEAVLVDTQAAFDEVLAGADKFDLAADRVHPGPVGHMVIARAFLKAIGLAW